MASHLAALVLAAGRGRRLAGFVRRHTGETRPKQFCRFGGTRTLLQETLARVDCRDVTIVVDRTQVEFARSECGHAHVVSQPLDRGTGPGVLLPLRAQLERTPDAAVLLTPSDHGVCDGAAFTRSLAAAHRAVDERVADVVLLGAAPTHAATDLGWILPGAELAPGLFAVERFVEKPARVLAGQLRDSGALWNTMVLVARGAALLDLYRRHLPGLYGVFEEAWRRPRKARERFLLDAYRVLGRSDFSRDLLGRAKGLAVHAWPAQVGWSDLGTPLRMTAWLERVAHPLRA